LPDEQKRESVSNQRYGSGIVTDTLTGVQRRKHGFMIERFEYPVHPVVVQLGVKLTDSPPLIVQESFHVKGDLSL
jgi:hypothetical protein